MNSCGRTFVKEMKRNPARHFLVYLIGFLLLSGAGLPSFENITAEAVYQSARHSITYKPASSGYDSPSAFHAAQLTSSGLEDETESECFILEENDDESNLLQYAAAHAFSVHYAYNNVKSILLRFGHSFFAINIKWHVLLCLFRI